MTTFKTPNGTQLPMLNLKGKDYLQVAHRLVWMREVMPKASIETSFIILEESHAICRAIIKDESGQLLATATKREDQKHFPDFMEKAETGAIGRALALCGFGTQFAPELDEGERVVDGPLTKKTNAPRDGVYRIPFGKYIDQTIEEAGLDNIFNYASWLHKSLAEKGEKPKPDVEEFFAQVKKARGA
jgi:hypothetical protein